jgi:hypothetical protein
MSFRRFATRNTPVNSVLVQAYRQMLTAHARCSVDRILEYPDLRAEFLSLVGRTCDRPEGDVLHGLNNLRKQRKLPRRDDITTPKA